MSENQNMSQERDHEVVYSDDRKTRCRQFASKLRLAGAWPASLARDPALGHHYFLNDYN